MRETQIEIIWWLTPQMPAPVRFLAEARSMELSLCLHYMVARTQTQPSQAAF